MADPARRLLVASFLIAVVAVSVACQNGDAADRSASDAPPASATPSTNVEQNSFAVCTQVIAAVGGFSSAALRDAKELSSGQLTREEFGERLRPLFTTAATKLRQLAPEAVDETLRTAIEGWARRMDEGATAPDPTEFHTMQFGTVYDEIEKTCKLG